MSEQEQKPPENYEAVQPFLKAAFEQILAAGCGVRDTVEFSLVSGVVKSTERHDERH